MYMLGWKVKCLKFNFISKILDKVKFPDILLFISYIYKSQVYKNTFQAARYSHKNI